MKTTHFLAYFDVNFSENMFLNLLKVCWWDPKAYILGSSSQFAPGVFGKQCECKLNFVFQLKAVKPKKLQIFKSFLVVQNFNRILRIGYYNSSLNLQ